MLPSLELFYTEGNVLLLFGFNYWLSSFLRGFGFNTTKLLLLLLLLLLTPCEQSSAYHIFIYPTE